MSEKVQVDHGNREPLADPPGAGELGAEHLVEVARVVQAGLRIEAHLLPEGGKVERALDDEEGRNRERNEPRVEAPEGGDHDAQHREEELPGEVERPEETADVPSCRHGEEACAQQPIDGDDEDDGDDARERPVCLVGNGRGSGAGHTMRGQGCEQGGEHGSRDGQHPRAPGAALARELDGMLRDTDEGGKAR